MIVKGVLDRIEEGRIGVILVESLEKEFHLIVDKLPEGSKAGTWFDLEIANEDISSIHINVEMSMNMHEEVTTKVKKLKERSKGSRFKRN